MTLTQAYSIAGDTTGFFSSASRLNAKKVIEEKGSEEDKTHLRKLRSGSTKREGLSSVEPAMNSNFTLSKI